MNKPVVLITGALTGIGRATALAFAREGARIVISGRKENLGATLLKEIRDLGNEAEFIRADVSQEAEVKNLVDETVKRFGRLDVAVNNAGIEGIPGFIIDQTVENYQLIFNTNVLGVLLGLKHELKVMISQKSGSIINLSSILGQRGTPGGGIYVASKHAIEGLTKTAAIESAPSGVRVNAVAPGPIDTEMLDRFTGTVERKAAFVNNVPMKRMGTPEEVAQIIVFLASEKATYLTGEIIGVDGGRKA
jgi:NAD(P)-dependent dehydrogenase (short-subunit alcohol dehydrogenase family)